MKKVVVLFISLMFMVSLCLGVAPTNVLAEGHKLTYVAFGDSMAQGYQFLDYDETNPDHYCGWEGTSERSYIKKFAEDINAKLIDLTVQGLQPDEVYAFLAPETFDFESMTRGARKHIGWWVGDLHTDEEQWPDPVTGEGKYHIFDTFKDMSDYYIDAVKKADVITYDLGMNYFGTYLNDARDSDEIFTKLLLDSKYTRQIEEIRTKIANLLKKLNLDNANDILNGILYACTSYIVYGDKCIAQIKKLNPTAQIIMIPLSNPNREIYYELDGLKINYTEIIDIMFEYLNNYFRNISVNRDLYTVAELSSPVMSFADELYFYPNDLSEDAEKLLARTLYGETSLLGYDNYRVPAILQELYDNPDVKLMFSDPGAKAYFGTEDVLAYMITGEQVPVFDNDGKLMMRDLVFDQLVYNWIVNKYDVDRAYNDFFGDSYIASILAWGDPTPIIVGEECLCKDTFMKNFEEGKFNVSFKIHDYNIERAREAIENGNPAQWQTDIIAAIDDITDGWVDTCLKAATYRTLPAEALFADPEDIEFDLDDLKRILVDPDSATDSDYTWLHVAIRSGNAARGFGTHPCPRGLDNKYYGALNAYKPINYVECYDEEYAELDEGTYVLYLNGKNAGEYTFSKVATNWSIQNTNGKYLSVANGKLTNSDTEFAWTFEDGRFSAKEISLKGLIPRKTTYYLTLTDGKLALETSKHKAAKASFTQKINEHRHVAGEIVRENELLPTCVTRGHYDLVSYCDDCGKELTRVHYIADKTGVHVAGPKMAEVISGKKYLVTRCLVCNEIMSQEDFPAQVFDVSVKVTPKTKRVLFFKKTTYDVKVSVMPTETYFRINKVEYSLNGKQWTRGVTYTASKEPEKLYIRVTDSDGKIHHYLYSDKQVVPGN